MIKFAPRAVARYKKQSGFNLLELMVVLTILAILSAIIVPSFSDIVTRATLASQSRDLMASSLMARSEAIKRNQVVTLCASSNGSSCSDGRWEDGWIVIAFNNQVIHKHKALTEGILINSTLSRINFNASGLGASMASLTLCRAAPTVGRHQRVVTISATGRASVAKTESSECAPI